MTRQRETQSSSTAIYIFMAFVMLLGFMSNKPVTAYAAETKTAVLNNTKISFDGKAAMTVQTYNIDGNNYIRARDISNGLNMKVEALGDGAVGIRLFPDEPAVDTSPLEKLTEQSINVQLVDGELGYMNKRYPIKCFNYANRYYFKVADIAVASQDRLKDAIAQTERFATGGQKQAPPQDSFISVNVKWDSTSQTVSIDKKTTDLWAIFTSKGGSTVAKAEEKEPIVLDPSKSTLHPNTLKELEAMKNGTWQPIVPEFKKQAPLTEPPKVGTRLANILVDDSLGAYNEDGTINEDNIQPLYKYNALLSNFGQCAWYAEGRFAEVTGVDGRTNKYWAGTGNVSGWLDNVEKNNCPDVIAIKDIYDIRPQSIAVYDGHVAFIEYVERDSSGNPIKVYVTDANANRAVKPELESGIYHPEYDCLVKVFDFDVFINNSVSLKGYIIAK